MAEIVNLRQARKRADRAERDRTAAENRTRHGLSKADKLALRTQEQRRSAFIEGHRRDKQEDER